MCAQMCTVRSPTFVSATRDRKLASSDLCGICIRSFGEFLIPNIKTSNDSAQNHPLLRPTTMNYSTRYRPLFPYLSFVDNCAVKTIVISHPNRIGRSAVQIVVAHDFTSVHMYLFISSRNIVMQISNMSDRDNAY